MTGNVRIWNWACGITNQRVLYEAKSGTAGNGGAILKSKGTFISQALSELMLEAVGYYSSPWVMEALEVGWNETGSASAKHDVSGAVAGSS